MNIEDRLAIGDVLYTYAAGLDAQDWDLWRTAFADEITFDMSAVHGRPPITESIDKTISYIRIQFAGFEATQHMITNHRPTVDGDSARVLAHMRAEHWVDPSLAPERDRYSMFGYYDDRLVRTPDGWKLTDVQLNLTRTEGNPEVMAIAWRHGKELLG